MNRRGKYIILLILVAILMTGCLGSNKSISRKQLLLGTIINVAIYDSKDEKILDDVFNRIREIEDLVSINKESTEVLNINKNSGKQGVKVSDDTYHIVKRGLEYSKLSKGDYDISIGPLVKLWNIGMEDAKVPTKEEINDKLKYVGYENIKINDSKKEVFLLEEGMILDLGSIAKGYVADEIVKILKDKGVNKAIIDLGGNIYALGTNQKEDTWNIGIQNPFGDRGNTVGKIDVSNKSIVTTGVYERYIEKDGIRYHHILNPKNGYPYDTNIQGVSIISDKSIDGDALSTLVYTKGVEDGIKLLEGIDGVDGIFITNDKNIYMTDGIRDNFKLMDDDFKIKEL